MLKDLMKHNKMYWICLITTTIIAYGFKLANYSVHFEDLLYEHYKLDGGLIKMGRWGNIFFKDVINIPFWRTGIAMLLMIIGITILSGLLRKYTNGSLDEKAIIIFACITISFPAISTYFAIMCTSFEMGMIFFMSSLSLYFSYKWIIEKEKWLYGIIGAVCLGYAISFFEYAILIFLTFSFSLLLAREIALHPLKMKIKELTYCLLKLMLIVIFALVFWKLVGAIVQIANGFDVSGYVDDSIGGGYDRTGIFAFISSFTIFIFRFPFAYLRELFINKDSILEYITLYNSVCALLIVSIGVIYSIKRKNITIVIFGVLTIVSAFGIHFIMASVDTANRYLISMSIFIAFTFMLLYSLINERLRIILIIASIWTVFIQTKEMNMIFEMDYRRYQKDIFIMESILHDLGGREKIKPLVFSGKVHNELYIKNVNSHAPIFNWEPFVTELFFNYHGNQIRLASVDDRFIDEIINMNSWPNDGYIKEYNDFIVVKLGDEPRNLLTTNDIADNIVRQTFIMPATIAKKINGISFYLRSYGDISELNFKFGLTDLVIQDDQPLFEKTLNNIDIKSETYLCRIDFGDGIDIVTGKTYYFEVNTNKSGGTVDSYAFYLEGKDENIAGALFVNGEEIDGELVYEIHLSDKSTIADIQIWDWKSGGRDMHNHRYR